MAAILKQHGYSARDLRKAGFSAAALKRSWPAAEALKEAGFSVATLHAEGFTAAALKKAGYSHKILKRVGLFTAYELRNAGFSASALKEAGHAFPDMLEAGYPVETLKKLFPSAERKGRESTSLPQTSTALKKKTPFSSKKLPVQQLHSLVTQCPADSQEEEIPEEDIPEEDVHESCIANRAVTNVALCDGGDASDALCDKTASIVGMEPANELTPAENSPSATDTFQDIVVMPRVVTMSGEPINIGLKCVHVEQLCSSAASHLDVPLCCVALLHGSELLNNDQLIASLPMELPVCAVVDGPRAEVHAKLRQCEKGVADLQKMQEQINSLALSSDAYGASHQLEHLEFVHTIQHRSVKEEQSMIRTLRRLRQIINDSEKKTRQQDHLRSQIANREASLHEEIHLMLGAAKASGIHCSCFAEMSRWCCRTCRHSCKWHSTWSQLDIEDVYAHYAYSDYYSDFGDDLTADENKDEDATFAHPDGHWSSCSRAARARYNRSTHICRNKQMGTRRRRRTFRKEREGCRCNIVNGKDFMLQ